MILTVVAGYTVSVAIAAGLGALVVVGSATILTWFLILRP